MARLNLALSETHDALIDDLKELCDLKTAKDVIENALMLLGWAAAEAVKGRSIASVDEEHKVYQEVQTPALLGARMKAGLAKKREAVPESQARAPKAVRVQEEAEDAPPSEHKARAPARILG